MSGSNVVSLAARRPPNAAERALDGLLELIVGADDPVLAGLYVSAGIARWLVLHQGVAVAELLRAMAREIAARSRT
jgi:hypothetical protein